MTIKIGDALLHLGVDSSKLDADMKKAVGNIKSQMKATGVALTAMGTAIVGSFAIATKMAADFDSAMREVNTMMLLGEQEFAGFKAEVQEMSMALGVDAVASAKALYQAISAGVPKENAIEFLQVATKAAIGGVTDTETAVDGLTSVMNAFKIPIGEAQRVADLMFTTVKGGKTTFEELSASMFQIAPMAAAAGVEFDVVSAALATMTKQGVPTNVATTQLRQAIQAIIKPTEDMKTAIEASGYASGEAMLQSLGFAGTLDVLGEASGGSMETLGKMFGSVEGLQAVLSLTGENAKVFAADIDAMANSAGAATDAFGEMEKTAGRQLESLKVSMQGIGISIGNVLLPILSNLLDSIKPIIQNVIDWVKENPDLVKQIVILVGVVGGFAVVLGPILIMLPTLMAGFAALTGPIGIVIGAVMGLIMVGTLLWQNWDVIKEKTVEIWNNIVSFLKGIWNNITGFFQENWDKILAILFPAVGLPILIARNWDTIKDYVKGLWDTITNIIKNWVATIKKWIVDNLNPWEWMKRAWEGMRDGISGILKKIFGSSDVEVWASKLEKFIESRDLKHAGEQMMSTFRQGISDGLDAVTAMTKAKIEGLTAPRPSEGYYGFEGWDEQEANIQKGLMAFYAAHPFTDINAFMEEAEKVTGQKVSLATAAAMNLPGFEHGGMITEPTLLSSIKTGLPYAIAGEKGPEPVGQVGQSVLISGNNFYVRDESDIDRIGEALVDKIIARTGVR